MHSAGVEAYALSSSLLLIYGKTRKSGYT